MANGSDRADQTKPPQKPHDRMISPHPSDREDLSFIVVTRLVRQVDTATVGGDTTESQSNASHRTYAYEIY